MKMYRVQSGQISKRFKAHNFGDAIKQAFNFDLPKKVGVLTRIRTENYFKTDYLYNKGIGIWLYIDTRRAMEIADNK